MSLLRIATRKSPLAMWQAEFVKAQLLAQHPELSVELIGMSTQGDKLLDVPLAKIGGKGLFIKELEEQMLAGNAHLAVHSMKDLPAFLPEGFAIGAVLTGLLVGLGVMGGSLPLLLLVFAVMSVLAWLALRATMGVRDGQVKMWDKDINDN